MRSLAVSMLLGLLTMAAFGPAIADEPFKAQEPPADVAAALIAQAQGMKTGDGSTVMQTLRYAEQMRPDRFKLAPFDFGYSYDGTLYSVDGCFFTGLKRLPDDAECPLTWEITPDHKSLLPLPERTHDNVMTQSTMYALMDGRDSFLREIDGIYKETCIDSKTGAKLC